MKALLMIILSTVFMPDTVQAKAKDAVVQVATRLTK